MDVLKAADYIAGTVRHDLATPQTTCTAWQTFYEMLVGQHPFPNLTPVERLFKHLNDPVPRITALDLEVSKPVNDVIQKATAKNPNSACRCPCLRRHLREAAGLAAGLAGRNVVEVPTPREQEVLQLILKGKSTVNRRFAGRRGHDREVVRASITRSYTSGVGGRRVGELNLSEPGGAKPTSTVLGGAPDPESLSWPERASDGGRALLLWQGEAGREAGRQAQGEGGVRPIPGGCRPQRKREVEPGQSRTDPGLVAWRPARVGPLVHR
jgi:hypothetical protein